MPWHLALLEKNDKFNLSNGISAIKKRCFSFATLVEKGQRIFTFSVLLFFGYSIKTPPSYLLFDGYVV